jgi:hypothetical protein
MILPVLLWWSLLSGAAPCPAATMCSCAVPSVEIALDRAEAAFTGVVVGGGVFPGSGGPDDPVVFRVTRRFKGAAGDTVTLVDGGACAVGFRRGEEYMVYANRRYDGVLHTTFCHRSRVLTQAADDLRGLRETTPAAAGGRAGAGR